MRGLKTFAALAALTMMTMGAVRAEGPVKTKLKPFNVTIRVFDPTKVLRAARITCCRSTAGRGACYRLDDGQCGLIHEEDGWRQKRSGRLHVHQGRAALNEVRMSLEDDKTLVRACFAAPAVRKDG